MTMLGGWLGVTILYTYVGLMYIYMHIEVRGQLCCHSSELSILLLETGILTWCTLLG